MDVGDLNPAQRKAVLTRSGPLLVLAGAGTGKTRVVTFRIAELIRTGTAADRILAVTFTNKAAQEMQQRVSERLGKRKKARPLVSTFHSFCLKVLRRHIRLLGYPVKFAIHDRGDQESTARAVLRELRVSDAMLRPGDLLARVSHWKCRGVPPTDAAGEAESDKDHLAAAGYRRYQKALKNAGAVDFDDLLLCTEQLFREFPEVRRAEAGLFDHVLIDEYQDTNGTQYRIVKALASGHRNLCVVGDDDQSIYGWRGAEVDHILNFTRDWPEATVVRLEENYRSTQAIIEHANQLIAFNSKRHDKVLRAARPGGEKPRIEQFKNEEEEARGVVHEIRRHLTKREFSPRDFAILFRTNEQPRAFEAELRKARLPYVLMGTKSFYDRKEVRDILSYLKICDSPQEETALLRIINKPPRGIGGKTVERLLATAVERAESVGATIAGGYRPPESSAAAVAAIDRFATLIETYRERFSEAASQQRMSETLRELIRDIDYYAELQRSYNDPQERENRWNAVEEVVNALAGHERSHRKPSLRGFLDDVAVGDRDFDNDKEKQLQRDAIVLMTLHSAKGLEFPHVFMVGMEEGLLPHHRSVKAEGVAIDEERRLCYVGVTRAEERLTLSLALTRMKWGRPRDTIPSRFLYELIGAAERV